MSQAAPLSIHVVGFGMGPDHLTAEANRVLADADYVIAADKGLDDPLLSVRRAIAQSHGLPVVAVPDPARDRNDPADYGAAVRTWHAARKAAYREVLAQRGGRAVFLAWGDPALYDSYVRLVTDLAAELDAPWHVVAGISAPQMLAARHKIVLHEVGGPLHITTARQLADAVEAGQDNIVVMLTSDGSFEQLTGWDIWWGANLGHSSEKLVAGQLPDVHAQVAAARAEAKAEAGWVMDVALVRRS